MRKVRRRKEKATVYNIAENLKEMKIEKHGQKQNWNDFNSGWKTF